MGRYRLGRYGIAVAVFAAYVTISLFRYLRYDAASYDLGIFTEYVKRFAQLQAPVVDAWRPGADLLGDHFHPLVATLAPFFWFFPTPATILVAQALLVAASVVPVSRAAAELLGEHAGWAISVAYGFSWGLQDLVDYDFHEVAFAVPLLAFSLSALIRHRPKSAVIWALPMVLVKEDQGFVVGVIGLLIAFCYGEKILGLVLAGWGFAWSALAMLVIIPHFNAAHRYAYLTQLGSLDRSITLSGILHQAFNGSEVKLTTLALILLPTAFIALRSPLVLAAIPAVAPRLMSTDTVYWSANWQYNATVMPIVFLAAVDGMARMRARRVDPEPVPGWLQAARGMTPAPVQRFVRAAASRFGQHGIAMMLAICAALAFEFPLAGLWDRGTYRLGAHVAAERLAVALVPGGVTVATNVDLLGPLGAKDDAFWLGNSAIWLDRAGNPPTRYVVYDSTAFDLPPRSHDIPAYIAQLSQGARYNLAFYRDGIYVFVRA